jgi:hypothetical protein
MLIHVFSYKIDNSVEIYKCKLHLTSLGDQHNFLITLNSYKYLVNAEKNKLVPYY